MTDLALDRLAPIASRAVADPVAPLSSFRPGDAGVIARVAGQDAEQERRLLELGFVEGARVELLHQGLFGADPIAVRVDDMRVALRRREAAMVTLARQ